MENINIADKHKNSLKSFVEELKTIYAQELVSAVLYGSAASGEFVDKHSDINLLVVLKDASLEKMARASECVRKNKNIRALFMSDDYMKASIDVFPVEFLDMKENYTLIYGKDPLKDIKIDITHLRFQCEQELKSKLLKLKHAYIVSKDDKEALKDILFASFTSMLHIMRNALRLRSKTPPYPRSDVIKELSGVFGIDARLWNDILEAKSARVKLDAAHIAGVFEDFVKELEKISDIIDKA